MNIATALVFFWIGALLLWYEVFFCWREYRIASFKNRLYRLRYELFLYAYDHAVEFGHPLYRELEFHINSFICFATRISFFRLLSITVLSFVKPEYLQRSCLRTQLLDDRTLSHEVRINFLRVHERMIVQVGQHLIRTYPISWPFLLAYFAYTIVNRIIVYRFNLHRLLQSLRSVPAWVKPEIWGIAFSRNALLKPLQYLEGQAVATEIEASSTLQYS